MQMPIMIEPFIRRGMFADPDAAIAEMARDYIAPPRCGTSDNG